MSTMTPLTVPEPVNGGYKLVALGDSVMLGAAEELGALGFLVDAVVSRQMKTYLPDMQAIRDMGVFGSAVVVHLGTNGPFSQETLDQTMAVLADVPVVLVITSKAEREWVAGNNEKVRALPATPSERHGARLGGAGGRVRGRLLLRRRHPPQPAGPDLLHQPDQPGPRPDLTGPAPARPTVGLAAGLARRVRSAPMTTPVRVAVTGAAGQIGYSLLFRIASGSMLGPDTPVALQLLEITPALGALEGVRMELDDCAFPLLSEVVCTDDADTAFGDVDIAILVGSMPRKAGMERADLLSANGGIFKPQGESLSRSAKKDVKVLVVGNPANTNSLIAMSNAADLDPGRFTAMTRLDHNRAKTQLAQRLGVSVNDITKMTIWGNHSTTQYPDLFHCEVNGKNAYEAVGDHDWYDSTYIPTVAKRGAAIIEARGASSAASAASAAVDHVRDWVLGTPEGDWVSMSIPSDGSYGVPEGIISSFPCVCKDGDYEIVQGLEIDDYSRAKIDETAAELVSERDAVAELGLI